MGSLTLLKELLQDIDCLAPVTDELSKVNFFKVLKLENKEIRHSNMLKWLLDPHANHGLGDRVLRGFFGLVTPDLPSDYSGFRTRREEQWIDLLVFSKSEEIVICIENKTDTGEHDDQLSRYKQYVEDVYSGYKRYYVYMTKRGNAASDPETWIPVSYVEFITVLEKALTGVVLKPEVAMILDNYVDVIRTITGGENRIKKVCKEVYRRHSQAFDLLFEINATEYPDGYPSTEEYVIYKELFRKYRMELDEIDKVRPWEKIDPVTDTIRHWADEITLEGRIHTSLEARTDSYERFTTPVMSGFLPDAEGCRSGWGTENFYFYEIHNSKKKGSREHRVSMQLCVNMENIPNELRRASDRLSLIRAPLHNSEAHRIYLETRPKSLKENEDPGKVIDLLDSYLETIDAFEKELSFICHQ